MSDAILDAIRKPVRADAPAGDDLSSEDPLLEQIEAELMKRGSLTQDSIDWDGVQTAAITILSEKSKHLKAVTALCAALAAPKNPEAFQTALKAMQAFIDAHWAGSWPAAEAKGAARRRTAAAREIIQTLNAAATRLEKDYIGVPKEALHETAALQKAYQNAGLDDSGLQSLTQLVERLSSGEVQPPEPESQATPEPEAEAATPEDARPDAAQSPATMRPAATAPAPRTVLDARGVSLFKREIRSLADRIGDVDPDDPMGYRLRRYAAWYGDNIGPTVGEDGKGDVPRMPRFVADSFEQALKSGGSPEVLAKIEDRLFMSPDWLRGHYLAAGLAQSIGLKRGAEGIRVTLLDRMTRFPAMWTAQYAEGGAMLDPETQGWLSAAPVGTGTGGAALWDEVLAQALERLAEGDMPEGLAILDAGAAGATGAREGFYWRLAHAEFLKAAGAVTLAQSALQGLAEMMTDPVLEGWEPSLKSDVTQRLQALTAVEA